MVQTKAEWLAASEAVRAGDRRRLGPCPPFEEWERFYAGQMGPEEQLRMREFAGAYPEMAAYMSGGESVRAAIWNDALDQWVKEERERLGGLPSLETVLAFKCGELEDSEASRVRSLLVYFDLSDLVMGEFSDEEIAAMLEAARD